MPPPAYGRPPQQRPTWPWVLLGLFAATVFCCGGCGVFLAAVDTDKSDSSASAPEPVSGTAPAAAPNAAPPKAPEKRDPNAPAPAGSEVRDGKFAFVVTKVETGIKTVGDNRYSQRTAQGTYVLVYVDISNIGDRARTYSGDNQILIDDKGRQFRNDSLAELNFKQQDRWSSDINPGNHISAVVAFDVPADAVPAVMEFHDSGFSGGVKVALR